MKINKGKLIELLVEKTNMEKGEIEDQLQQLIQRIIDAAERGKALEIKEFGLFYFDENGDLKFDPAKELSTEINFKYAGMEPVELKPPRDAASEEVISDIDTDTEPEEEIGEPKREETDQDDEDLGDIFGLDDIDEEDIDEEVKAEESDVKPEQKRPFESPADKVDREDDPFSGLLGDASSKLSDSEKGFLESSPDEDEVPPFSFINDPGKTAEKPEKKAAPKAKSSKPSKSIKPEPKAKTKTQTKKPVIKPNTVVQPKRDPIMVVVGVVLVFVLIAAAFFVIPGLLQDSEPAEQQPLTETQTVTPESDASNILEPVEPAGQSAVEEESADVDEIVEQPASAESEQPLYGLNGELVDRANNGFSIVLHSFRQEETARQQAAQLASDGYRVLVSSRNVQGQTVWRVSVGQFQTIADAQEEAGGLPSPFNTNNFIQRIQTN
jgi:nucleoid DNA-binding protein